MSNKAISINFIFIILFISQTLLGQEENQGFADRFIVGSSFGYIVQKNPVLKDLVFHEMHWNKEAMISFNRLFYGGIRWHSIFTKGSSFDYFGDSWDKWESYYLVGAFSEIDVIPKFQHRGIIRLGWNYGNYCVCGETDPYRQEGIHYPSISFGGEYYFAKNLAVSIEGETLLMLSKSVPVEAFTRYGIGLKYSILSKK